MHHVKISLHICIPFDGIASYHDSDLEVRINCDICHLRRMVASLIIKFFPGMGHYSTFVLIQINFFFSSIYLNYSQNSQIYSTYQFLHPVFFNSKDRIKFIDMLREYSYQIDTINFSIQWLYSLNTSINLIRLAELKNIRWRNWYVEYIWEWLK